MKLLTLLISIFSFSVSSSELMIFDEGRYLYFIVIGNDADEIPVETRAFNMNDGLIIDIYTGDNSFHIGGSDKGKIIADKFNLTDSVIVGRRLPKMFLSAFYNMSKSGYYFIDVKICLNEKNA
jgi:hypothetical protein